MAQNKFLDNNGLLYLWNKIKGILPKSTSELTNDSGYITADDIPDATPASTTSPKMNGTAAVGTEDAYARGDHVHPSDTTKVDKVDGMGLSHNDYTTTDKDKLAGIEDGANNYTLPDATGSVKGGVKIGDNVDVDGGTISVKDGSTAQKGVVQLSSATNSTDTDKAATPSAVKEAYDLANGKQSPATSLSGYGITDAYTKEEVDGLVSSALHYKGSVDTYGHWEMDSVMGCQGSHKALLVLTERLTREGIILLVKDHTAASVVRALNGLERRFGKEFYNIFKSITVDNGCEFQDFEGIEKAQRRHGKRTVVYFCHPYSAYERGSNENMNRLIRRFFPKGTNFDTVLASDIKAAEEWINNYPRKVLGWKSASMLFEEELLAA